MNLYTMPAVLRETSEGLSRCGIPDIMLQRREVECVGDIDREAVYCLALQLRYLAAEDNSSEIAMYINSPGGSVSDGLALYDVMRALPCPVRTVCLGTAASMAALLFAAGARRDILPHARVMIHDPLTPGVSGSALKLDAVARDIMRTRETMARILSEHTGRTLEEVYAKTATDSFFSAEEAVAWGLADNIITTL